MSLGAVMISWTLTSPAPAPEITACAEAPSDVDDHATGDDQLMAAANCAQERKLPATTRALLGRLLVEYPESPHWLEAAHRLAQLDRTRADFRRVAIHLERIARRFPKDARSPDALLDAAHLWAELGERAHAEAALTLFGRYFRRKRPGQALEAEWARVELAADDDERLERARAFLRRSFDGPSMDLRAVAEATVGRILWARSCRSPGPDGECLRPVAARETPCGIEAGPGFEVRRRKARLAKRAQEHFATVRWIARGEAEILDPGTRRAEAYADAIGMAAVMSVDADLETFMATSPRRPRNPTPTDDREFLADLRRSMSSLIERYAQIRPQGDSVAWHLVAAQRVGRLTDHTAHRVAHLEPSRGLPVSTRCQAIAKEHTALVKHSTDAHRYCLDKSIMVQHFGAATARCEAVMQVRDPALVPRNDEFRGAPSVGVMPPRAAGVVLDVDAAWETGTRLLGATDDQGAPPTSTPPSG